MLCYGDALAVVASGVYGFRDVDFGKFHPAGALGKKLLLRVSNLMETGENNAIVHVDATLMDAIVKLSDKGLGIVSVTDDEENLCGVITDGDLRRQLNNRVDIYGLNVKDVMTCNPKTIQMKQMAIEALQMMKEKNINALPVLDGNRVVGTIRLQSIIQAGIV